MFFLDLVCCPLHLVQLDILCHSPVVGPPSLEHFLQIHRIINCQLAYFLFFRPLALQQFFKVFHWDCLKWYLWVILCGLFHFSLLISGIDLLGNSLVDIPDGGFNLHVGDISFDKRFFVSSFNMSGDIVLPLFPHCWNYLLFIVFLL